MSLDLKYRIHEISKDLNVNSREIMDILTKYSSAPKNHMAVPNDDELNIIFDWYTKDRSIESIADYFAYFAEKEQELKEEKAKTDVFPKNEVKPDGKNTPENNAAADQPSTPQAPVQTSPAKKPDRQPSKGENAQRGVRHVDMRTSNVDLSKFDDKIDELVPDKAKDLGKQMEKFKKNQSRNQRYQQKPRDDEAEKLKKLEAEKNVQKQLHLVLPEEMPVSDLAAALRVTNAEVTKKLMQLGVMATAAQIIDYETAAIVAVEFGCKVDKEVIITKEELLIDDTTDTEEQLKSRAPVVVVMGHVDHGKTSLLDAIRNANVTEGEAGGITQHIGAYRVPIHDREITFLDTPGHEAFTEMRARGAQVTDIAILVVAADDGIMPQTVEAINHVKAAGVSLIVAINKIDKDNADVNKVMQELTEYELVPEEWGGDLVCIPVSAKEKTNLEQLLEMVILTADMKDLKANPDRKATGTVVEARLDKGKGPIATILIQNGTLHTGDVVIAGTTVGHVRVMTDDKGEIVKNAGPSVPVEIIGLSEVPAAGDVFHSVKDEKMARDVVGQRKHQEKEEKNKNVNQTITLDDLFEQIKQGEVKNLNIIVKADVQGSAEAVKASLEKLSCEEVRVRVIHCGVGGIKETDIMLALASNAIVVGFNVRPDFGAAESAADNNIDVRLYRIIYDCIEEIEAAMKGMLTPKFKEVVTGHASVRQIFKVSQLGTIAGCHMTDGKIARSSKVRLVRDGVVVYEGELNSLKRFKDDVKEVSDGYECGLSLEKFNDIKEGDIVEAYIFEQIPH